MDDIQTKIKTAEDEITCLRSAINDTVIRRDRLNDAMERWYSSQPTKPLPGVELELLRQAYEHIMMG